MDKIKPPQEGLLGHWDPNSPCNTFDQGGNLEELNDLAKTADDFTTDIYHKHLQQIETILQAIIGHLSKEEIKNRVERVVCYHPSVTVAFETYKLDGKVFLEVKPMSDDRGLFTGYEYVFDYQKEEPTNG
jgi:hypothetical protein